MMFDHHEGANEMAGIELLDGSTARSLGLSAAPGPLDRSLVATFHGTAEAPALTIRSHVDAVNAHS